MAAIRRLTAATLDLAFPALCSGCGREGPPLCPDCLPELDARLGLPGGTPLGLPADIPAPLLQLDWCAPFAGAVRHGLHDLKYKGERRLAEPFGAAVARRWARVGSGAQVARARPRPRGPGAAARLRSGGPDRGGGGPRPRSARRSARSSAGGRRSPSSSSAATSARPMSRVRSRLGPGGRTVAGPGRLWSVAGCCWSTMWSPPGRRWRPARPRSVVPVPSLSVRSRSPGSDDLRRRRAGEAAYTRSQAVHDATLAPPRRDQNGRPRPGGFA